MASSETGIEVPRWAGTSNYGLQFKKGNNNFEIFADADWGNDVNDRKSFSGLVVKYGECLINWEARKQQSVAYSSTEAEYYSMGEAVKESKYLHNFFIDIFGYCLPAITVYNDNLSAQNIVENNLCHRRTKHIDIRHHFIQEAVNDNFVKIVYKPTAEMIPDILTKPLQKCKHNYFVKSLCLV